MARRWRKNEEAPAAEVGHNGLRFALGRSYWLFKQTKIDNGFCDVHVQAPLSVCRGLVGDATRLRDPPVIDIPDKPTNNELAAAVEMRSDFATQV